MRAGADGGVVVGHVRVCVVPKVIEARRGRKVRRPQVARAPGWVDLASEHARHDVEAALPRKANLQDGVRLAGTALFKQRPHLHGGCHVQEHHELLAALANLCQQLQLLGAEFQLVLTGPVVGRLLVGHEHLRLARLKRGEKVLAQVRPLTGGTADHHDTHRAGQTLADRLGIRRPGHLAQVVRDRLGRIERAHRGARVLRRLCDKEVEGRIVDGKPRRLAGIAQAYGMREVYERRTRSVIDRVGRSAPKQRDARARSQRKRAVLVAQEHDASGLDLLRHGFRCQARLLNGGVGRLVVLGVPTRRVCKGLDRSDGLGDVAPIVPVTRAGRIAACRCERGGAKARQGKSLSPRDALLHVHAASPSHRHPRLW